MSLTAINLSNTLTNISVYVFRLLTIVAYMVAPLNCYATEKPPFEFKGMSMTLK
jgi:hypothetical protein